VESAEMGATAALCEAAWDVSSTVRQAEADAGTAMTQAFNNRAAGTEGLRRKVRGLDQ